MSRRTDFKNVAIIFYDAEAGRMTIVLWKQAFAFTNERTDGDNS